MYRNDFPRLYELRDQIKSPDNLNPFWKNLDATLQDPDKRRKCRPYETALQSLDSAAWEFLKEEASKYLIKWDEKNARGQQQLIDILNQARGYNFLKERGCSNIRFIRRPKITSIETPDLEGTLGDIKIICEVKTINISDDEALTRREMSHFFRPRCDQAPCKLEQGFFKKLEQDIKKAKSQIEAHAEGKETAKIIYIIPNFDDFWGEQKEKYYQQIDEYLRDNKMPGIEIVFHNQLTAFHTAVTMQYATVINDPE
jgi:hypothetical protein